MNTTLPVVCTVKVIYAYMAKEEGDLNLKKGDIINVHDNEGGWWNGTLVPDGINGTFPSNFVELVNDSNDSLDITISPTRPSRQHSRQGSVDSSKFTKRKPVNVITTKNTLTDSINNSTISLGARKNPQAMVGDSGLCSVMPGAFPTSESPQDILSVFPNSTPYQRRNSTNTAILNPSGPSSSLTPAQSSNGKHVTNRYSMPNLARDVMNLQPQPNQHNLQINGIHDGQRPMPSVYNHNTINQDSSCTPATRSTFHLPHGRYYSENSGSIAHYEIPNKHEILSDHNHSGDSNYFQPGMMPRSSEDGHHQCIYNSNQIGNIPVNNTPGRKTSIHNVGILPFDPPSLQQGTFSTNPLDLSLDNLITHNRSHSALARGRSVSQSNLRTDVSLALSPLDHYHQSQQQQRQHNQQHHHHQSHSTPMARMSLGPRAPNPSILIPPFGQRRQSAMASFGSTQISPTESSPSSAGGTLTSPHYNFLGSPTTPDTALSKEMATPTSAGTSMSDASTFGFQDNKRKSETARMPPSASMMAPNFTARKFSVDANRLLSSVADMELTSNSPSDILEDTNENLENLGTYTARKPKATLIRAFKQIINPKKVAEKDAIRNKNEHFAWIEMQKSLKRVNSPEIGKEQSLFHFFGDGRSDEFHQPSLELDPFEFTKRCQVMRDLTSTAPAINSILDFGPNTFAQVDKVARNVNQRGNHLTPQILSQKYLTRPYSKSPISKLRVIFVWVSENIRLEGGPTRDVSGGRFKLGPAGDYMAARAALANGNTVGESPSLRSGATAPPPAVFMTGVEEYARGFIQEDTPELAQDVLTTRTCKTGEGFANLFAEMALAAGIDDVGVVKGYIKGPMDVFSKDIPPPNHAWNVVRIDGTYRFIDCCLASPFHPAHYPSRPQAASSFYFLTSPTDMVLSHCPVFLTYQYITPSIPPQIFLQLPFVRPAYFDYGLSLPDFRKLTKLDIKDDEPIEITVRIDGGGNLLSSTPINGQNTAVGAGVQGLFPGYYGGECVGKGCGEGIELRAEVEAINGEGKVIRKRALAQVMIWNPYQYSTLAPQQSLPQGTTSSTFSVASGMNVVNSNAAPCNRSLQSHHCTGIRIAKIKAVLPPETVICPGGVRKGVVHIYAGRKVESAPSDATPYSLAMTLPIRHTGSMPKTPLNFVHPHFSPYEFYVKAPQTELLYYPHTYKFCIISLAAQAQATLASVNAQAIAENESNSTTGINSSGVSVGSTASTMTSPRHMRSMGGSIGSGTPVGSSSLNPLYRPHQQQNTPNLRGIPSASAQTLLQSGLHSGHGSRIPLSSTTTSMGTMRGGFKNHPYQHQHYKMNSSASMASSSSSSVTGNEGPANVGGGVVIPRPERLVLRTQSNRTYKLVYDPLRQCHETQVDVKERGIWECVRMDDGGRNRVGREGTGGVVIASWRCV